ncbi:MAG: hypothetical protein ABI114_01690 [Rhodanobacter sp.]
MNTILHIDTPLNAGYNSVSRSPVRDFAEELNKESGKALEGCAHNEGNSSRNQSSHNGGVLELEEDVLQTADSLGLTASAGIGLTTITREAVRVSSCVVSAARREAASDAIAQLLPTEWRLHLEQMNALVPSQVCSGSDQSATQEQGPLPSPQYGAIPDLRPLTMLPLFLDTKQEMPSVRRSPPTYGFASTVPTDNHLPAKAPSKPKEHLANIRETKLIAHQVPVPVITTAAEAVEWLATQEQLAAAVPPTGVTESLLGSRVFGVHLLANAYLSELTLPETSHSKADVAMAVVNNDPSPTQFTPFDARSDANMSFDISPRNGSEAALVFLSNGDTELEPSEPTQREVPLAASAAFPQVIWPESLLRVTRRGDGSATLWIRDYRTSAESILRLVNTFALATSERGMFLGRIILNGHEVWTSHKKH